MANPGVQDIIRTIPVTITSGTALSPAVSVDGLVLVGVQLPAAWDAAGITFQVSWDGSTFTNLSTQTAELALTTAAVITNLFGTLLIGPVRTVKVRSGTSSVPVNQTADRIVTLICAKAFAT
jgi:hypothetical protein